ncbi:MAG TPA: hypothetical protein VGI20_10070 [Rhizomicrobium sp.]|jgi:hypothetical protein
MSGTKLNLNFEGFNGYYNNLYHTGYGGFDWFNMLELNNSLIKELGFCDTGYNNALHGQGEAVAVETTSFMYTYSQTFNLRSGVFASAWDTNQPVHIYAYDSSFSLKGSIEVNLSQTPTTIHFGNYGKEFKNLAEIKITVGNGQAGSTCTYGQATYGYQIAFDNLKMTVHALGTVRPTHGAFLRSMTHHSAHPFAALPTHEHASDHACGADHQTAGHFGPASYHSALNSLDAALGHNDSASLTSRFVLPHLEHFGT